MQELHTALRPGDEVNVRAAEWLVESLEPGDRATAVDLLGAGVETSGTRRTLLAPFDDMRHTPARARPRALRQGAALAALAALPGHTLPWPAPRVAVNAAVDVLPHQLTACLALKTGRATRVLIADPVGTGKTVQAALAAADTLERHAAARVLVIVPAGLRAQWRDEFGSRFGLAPHLVEGAPALPSAACASDESPWTRPGLLLTSLDYVKRADVLPALDGLSWDLVIVDEAHHATAATDRGQAVGAICRRALRVLLVTATPHDGNEARFRALCDLGRLDRDQRLLVLRRPATLLRTGVRRRARVFHVTLSPEERRARTLLDGYMRALGEADHATGDSRAGALLATVFAKRAASSAAALERTARRRLEYRSASNGTGETQWPLPGLEPAEAADPGDDEGHGILARATPVDWRKERAWLGAIVEAAARARHHCHKLALLRRVLARTREPAIVFTEYRDTLAWLHHELLGLGPGGHLHGLQTAAERQQHLDAFDRGELRWVLATDVAAEGLNLHRRCRFVVEFDQPWTPLRSWQRVGRVDRIGQTRRVHAWRFVSGDGIDARLQASLGERAAMATGSLDRQHHVDDDGSSGERGIALALRAARRVPLASRSSVAAVTTATPRLVLVDRRRWSRWKLDPGTLLALVEVAIMEGDRERLESIAVPLAIALDPGLQARERDAAALLLERARVAARAHAEVRVAWLQAQLRGTGDVQGRRAQLVESARRASLAAHFAQPGLFGSPHISGPRRPQDEPHEPPLAVDGRHEVRASTHVRALFVPRWREGAEVCR